MKNIFVFTAVLFFIAATSIAQTALPTSFSFDVAYPAGWTSNTISTYAASSTAHTIPSCKLELTGRFVQIFYGEDAGILSYWIKGATGGSAWSGTFDVQQSVDGSSWTTMHTFTDGQLNVSTYIQYNDTPNAASRYIRFFYTNKVSGSNVGLDDVNLALPTSSPAQEINLTESGNTIFNGGTFAFGSPVGVATNDTFLIENLGTANALMLGTITFSGTAASDYALVSSPTTISASSTGNLILSFTPSQAGTRPAIVSIVNDDANENPYVINLYGIGGQYATEPTASATNMTFTNVKSYRVTCSFTPAAPAPEGYLVLRSVGTAVSGSPTDGTIYQRGDAIGNAKVISVGTATSVVPNNIMASTDYHFAVFCYNGPGQFVNYFTTGALTGSVISSGANMNNYYAAISSTASTLKDDLHNLINPHRQVYYNDYDETMVALFSSRDTAGGQKVITCAYSGLNQVYSEPFDWTTIDFSREHTYCHSWMPTYPADNPEKPEYNDQFHLFPTKFANVNEIRSAYPLGEVVTVSSNYLEGKFGTDAGGNTCYEPRDEHKGDAARALMYMCVAYDGVSGNRWFLRASQNENVLKRWHYDDPPDAWEIARNDFLDSLQQNRNPFIDSVQFACYIDFHTLTYISNPMVPCRTVGVDENEIFSQSISLLPNPNNGKFILNYELLNPQRGEIIVTDISGREVWKKNISGNEGNNSLAIDESKLAKGFYLLRMKFEKANAVVKFEVQ